MGVGAASRYINETAWAQSREEVKSLKAVVDRYTYCVTLDTGLFPEFKAEGDTLNDDGIHPYDKLAVGTRLADAAAKDFYGAEGLWSSPVVPIGGFRRRKGDRHIR